MFEKRTQAYVSGYETIIVSCAKWVKRLGCQGCKLALLAGGQSGYGIYVQGDRRRRPVARVSLCDVETAIRQDLIEPAGAGMFQLSQGGRAKLALCEAVPDLAYQSQHGALERRSIMVEDRVQLVMARSRSAHPLARYRQSHVDRPAILDKVHESAADIFMCDYERSSMAQNVTANWSAIPGPKTPRGPSKMDAPDHRLDAKARFMDAIEALGPGLDHLLMNILIRQTGMTHAERQMGWPSRTGAMALKLALERLAVHYRLKAADGVYA